MRKRQNFDLIQNCSVGSMLLVVALHGSQSSVAREGVSSAHLHLLLLPPLHRLHSLDVVAPVQGAMLSPWQPFVFKTSQW